MKFLLGNFPTVFPQKLPRKSNRKFHRPTIKIPRFGRVDLLVFDGGQGVGGFFVFFWGMERKKCWIKESEFPPGGRVECLGFVVVTWDFVFLVMFFYVVAWWISIKLPIGRFFLELVPSILNILRKSKFMFRKDKDKTNVTSISLGGMVQVFVLRDNIPLTLLTKDRNLWFSLLRERLFWFCEKPNRDDS